MNPHHRAHFIHAVPTGVDHDLTVNVAVFGVNCPTVIGMLGEGGDRAIAINLGTGLAGAPGKSLTELGRVDISVQRIPQAPDQIVRGDQRVTPGAFFGINHLKMHIHSARHRRKMAIAVHLCLGVCQTNAAIAVMIIDGIFGVVCQFLVKIDGMGFQTNHGLGHAKVGDLSGRMPCRAGCQLIAFNQDNIAPALLRQVIKCGTARNTATDHNTTCLGFHHSSPENV